MAYIGLLVVCVACITSGGQVDATEQIHLSLGPNASQMVVTWVSQGSPPQESLVEYGVLNEIAKEKAYGKWTAFHPSDDRTIYVHRVTMTNLQPNSTYGEND